MKVESHARHVRLWWLSCVVPTLLKCARGTHCDDNTRTVRTHTPHIVGSPREKSVAWALHAHTHTYTQIDAQEKKNINSLLLSQSLVLFLSTKEAQERRLHCSPVALCSSRSMSEACSLCASSGSRRKRDPTQDTLTVVRDKKGEDGGGGKRGGRRCAEVNCDVARETMESLMGMG